MKKKKEGKKMRRYDVKEVMRLIYLYISFILKCNFISILYNESAKKLFQ